MTGPAQGRTGRIVVAALVFLLAAGVGIFVSTRSAQAQEVLLEPTASVGPEPYLDGSAQPDPTAEPAATPTGGAAPTFPIPDVLKKVPALTGLYGGSGTDKTCDIGKLTAFLKANADKAAAWAKVHGISVEQIPDFIKKLVAVKLKQDARVTNHGFKNGLATVRQAVLQAGTAILVDLFGKPAVRCKCGNPLLAPKTLKKVTYKGAAWKDFAAAKVAPLPFVAASAEPTATEEPPATTTPVPSKPAPKIVNLSLGASATASSTFSPEFPARLGVDGDPTSSWFSSGSAAGPSVYTIALKKAATITRIEFVNNGAHDNSAFRSGFGFRQWTLELLDASKKVVHTARSGGSGLVSQNVRIPGIAGVAFVRFTGTQHEAHNCGGFAELRTIGYVA